MKLLLLIAILFSVGCRGAEAAEGAVEEAVPAHCHSETVNSNVRLATLKIEEVKLPLIFSSFIIIVILAKIGWHYPWMHVISSNIPESCMLIVLGTHIGGILVASFRLDECTPNDNLPFRFTPQLFFVFLLPPIIFASGYFLDNRAFFENIISILMYAVIGTVWNAFALGFTLYGLSVAGLMDSHLSIPSALLFGTICAAVDPVAVLAVFDEIHVNKLLHILVFGESLLNDAVTIVLFQVLGAFANIEFDHETTHNIGVDVAVGFAQFFVVVIASIIIGFIFGIITCLLTRLTHHVHVLEPVFLFVLGYLSYLCADLFAFSGIISLIVFAIMVKHYVPPNLSFKSNITFKYFLKMINVLAEMVIFLYLGIALYDDHFHSWDTGLVLWTIVLTLIFRPIGTFVLTLLLNRLRFHKITLKDTFIMSFSGLRGAVAFSLALTRLFEEGQSSLPEGERTLRKRMVTAVTALLLFTVFVQGTTIKPLVRMIKVKIENVHQVSLNEVIHNDTMEHINSGMQDIAGTFGFNRLVEILQFLDVKYFRKLFERFPEAKDRDIINKFKKLQFKESTQEVESHHCNTETHEEHRLLNDEVCEAAKSCEDAVPILDEILKANRFNPHEDHYNHVIIHDENDEIDHHLQKVKLRKRLQVRKGRRSTFQRRHTTPSFPTIPTSSRTGLVASPLEAIEETDSGRDRLVSLSAVIGQTDEPMIDPHSVPQASSNDTPL
ncbi:PREDICTED: sodium/hydrogen exchanger 3-like isoform X2 [Amphimedon queenslandica]|uniref:Sodium/hydrogen exchanger n=1 Tax=Amphimedon queenslandica TaxID=400682 RepID=A0A1X7UH58_AMPQE|nr:PREDICTED: sodium/hydrogen exchanger 3-like isoform X2 [Amphimedon queenslandica]|eukprot:XP_019854262.1 PREDICTED: sodium/hydrogen exchanger 3-like isoform X2 [Amphimedon queenslandica]